MFGLLRFVIGFAIGSFVVRLFAALGIAVASYSFINEYLEAAFSYMQTLYSGLPADVTSILALAGVPEGLSIIGSAIMTAGILFSARVVFTRA